MLLKNVDEDVVETVPLQVCGGTFVSDTLIFPPGRFTYEVQGIDMNGVSFKFDLKKEVAFESNEGLYELSKLSDADTPPIYIEYGKELEINYYLQNKGDHCTNFNISIPSLNGFDIRIEPRYVTAKELVLQGMESIYITVTARPTTAATQDGQELVFIASNLCSDLINRTPVIVYEVYQNLILKN